MCACLGIGRGEPASELGVWPETDDATLCPDAHFNRQFDKIQSRSRASLYEKVKNVHGCSEEHATPVVI